VVDVEGLHEASVIQHFPVILGSQCLVYGFSYLLDCIGDAGDKG